MTRVEFYNEVCYNVYKLIDNRSLKTRVMLGYKDGCRNHPFFLGVTHMDGRKVLVKIISKVFSIYNIKIDLDLDDVKSYKNTESTSDSVSYKKHTLDLSVCVAHHTNDKLFYHYDIHKSEIIKEQYRLRVNGKTVEYILKRSLRVINSLLKVYVSHSLCGLEVYNAYDEAIEMAIVALALNKPLHSPEMESLIKAICRLLKQLTKWSNRTYEGRKVPFAYMINYTPYDYGIHANEVTDKNDKIVTNLNSINDFLNDDASALLTDGITSYFDVDEAISYKVVDTYYDAESESGFTKRITPIVPYRFASFGYACDGSKLGIVLTVQGDILFIKNRKLIFAKRNGNWYAYDYNLFNRILYPELRKSYDELTKGEERENYIKRIYLTCLDVAFARTGGCLALCSDGSIKSVLIGISDEDKHRPYYQGKRDEDTKKRFFLENVVVSNTRFDKLSRKARQELLGIDGATIVTYNGQFITTGAIINNDIKSEDDKAIKPKEKSTGGAREKIAMKLSEYGIAIKISADGYIKCYFGGKHVY